MDAYQQVKEFNRLFEELVLLPEEEFRCFTKYVLDGTVSRSCTKEMKRIVEYAKLQRENQVCPSLLTIA